MLFAAFVVQLAGTELAVGRVADRVVGRLAGWVAGKDWRRRAQAGHTWAGCMAGHRAARKAAGHRVGYRLEVAHMAVARMAE